MTIEPSYWRRSATTFSPSRGRSYHLRSPSFPIPSSSPTEVEYVSGVSVDRGNQPLVISSEEQSIIEITGWAVDEDAEEDMGGGVYVDIRQ